jgi:hypothetical protein
VCHVVVYWVHSMMKQELACRVEEDGLIGHARHGGSLGAV